MSEFETTYDRMELKINVGKSEVLLVKMAQRESCEKVKGSSKEMLIMISSDRGMGKGVAHRVLTGRKILWTVEREHDIYRSKEW